MLQAQMVQELIVSLKRVCTSLFMIAVARMPAPVSGSKCKRFPLGASAPFPTAFHKVLCAFCDVMLVLLLVQVRFGSSSNSRKG